MHPERTMQFILDNLSALTVSQQRTDVQMRGLQTLVKTGMRLIVKLEHGQKNLEAKVSALVDAQIRTEQSLAELAAAQTRRSEIRPLAQLYE